MTHLKLRALLIITNLILVTMTCYSQVNYTEKILNGENIKLSIANDDLKESFIKSTIRKFRADAAQALKADSVGKFIQFLEVKTATFGNAEYALFSNPEYEMGHLAAGNYPLILTQLVQLPEINKWGFRFLKNEEVKSYYVDDNFDKELQAVLLEKQEQIISEIEQLDDEQQQVLKIFLTYMLALQDIKEDQYFEQLFASVGAFDAQYPNSKFRAFSDALKKIHYQTGDIGLATMIGTGIYIPTSGLDDHFSFSVPLYLLAEGNYKIFTLSVGFGASIGQKIQKEFESDTLWLRGDNTLMSMAEILVGVNVYQSERINIFLKSGWRGLGVVPPGSDRYEDIDNVTSSFSLNYGIGFDYKWKPKKSLPVYSIKSKERKMTNFVRLHFNFQNPDFEKKVPTFDGNVYAIRIAFGQQILFPRRVR